MSARIFIAATSPGLARAGLGRSGTWQVDRLLVNHDVRCLAANPLNPYVVYAGTQGNGVLRSDDAGTSWRPFGLSGTIVKSLAVSQVEPDTIYAGTKPAQVFVSRGGNAIWTELESFRRIRSRRLWFSPAEKPFSAYVQAIALSPTDPKVILVGIEAGAVVASTDGGQTWSGHRRHAPRDCHTLVFHIANGNWAYAGGGGIARWGSNGFSQDAGQTWTSTRCGLDRFYGWAVAADPVSPEVWYLSASPGPFKAHSASNAHAYIFRHDGRCWQRLAGGLPQPLNHMPYALITDYQAPGHIYAGLSNGDIWHSADYGEHWRQLPVTVGTIERSMLMLHES